MRSFLQPCWDCTRHSLPGSGIFVPEPGILFHRIQKPLPQIFFSLAKAAYMIFTPAMSKSTVT